jgi:malate/lactate dehydrogenase
MTDILQQSLTDSTLDTMYNNVESALIETYSELSGNTEELSTAEEIFDAVVTSSLDNQNANAYFDISTASHLIMTADIYDNQPDNLQRRSDLLQEAYDIISKLQTEIVE